MSDTNAEVLAHIETLNDSHHFQWFFDRFVKEPMEEADVVLHDLSKSPEERENALRKWSLLNDIITSLKEREQVARRELAKKKTE